MLGSFGPHPEGKPHEGKFEEESPSGLVARSGTYHARSRVVDDDGEVFAGLYSRNYDKDISTDARHSQTGSGLSSLPRSGK